MFVRIPQLQPFNNIIQSNTVAFFFCIVLNLIHHFKIQFCLISIQLISTGFEASFNTPCLKAFSTKVIRIKGNIAGWENSGITHRDGSAAGNYWRIVRGVPGMVLRVEYEVPASLGFVVGDLKIGGRRIEYGGQLAEHITVSLTSTIGTSKKG